MGEVDLVLRHLSRRYAETLVKSYGQLSEPVRVLEWVDSVLIERERRLDKALKVSVGGRERLLHLEFQWQMRPDMAHRVFEYQSMLARALREEHRGPIPPIKSVVILLQGPASTARTEAAFDLSWPGDPFSGVHFEIDPIYATTVADLLERGGGFWLALAPLTKDADVSNLEEVMQVLKATEEDPERLADVAATMAVLADHDPQHRGLGPLVIETLTEEIIMQSTIGQRLFDRGRKEGRNEGRKEGRNEGRNEGLERALALQVQHRLQRVLTRAELSLLHARLGEFGVERLTEVVLDSPGGSEVMAWLEDPA